MGIRDDEVPPRAIEWVMWILFGVAIVAAALRTVTRAISKRRLFLDDAFLIFACLALTVASAILQRELETLNFARETVKLYVSGAEIPADPEFLGMISRYQLVVYVHGTMGWLVIFAVKLSFLSFFRQLVNRLPRLHMYWRTVVSFNILAFGYCILYVTGECPHEGLAALQCLHASGIERAAGLVGAGIGLDIVTDLLSQSPRTEPDVEKLSGLVVSIPMIIIWKVRMRMTQKLGITAFLCLSICMIAMASVRLSGMIVSHGSTIGSWQYFWLEIEACVAVIMVSLTAFRFVFADQTRLQIAHKHKHWYSSTVARNAERRQLQKKQQHGVGSHVSVPSCPSYHDTETVVRRSWLAFDFDFAFEEDDHPS